MDLAGKPGSSEQKIFEALDQPANFDFLDTPLTEVAEYLSTNYRINVVRIDLPAGLRSRISDQLLRLQDPPPG